MHERLMAAGKPKDSDSSLQTQTTNNTEYNG